MTEEARKAAAALRLIADQVEAGGVSEVEIKVGYHEPAVLIDAIRQTFEPPAKCDRCRPIAIVTTPDRIRRDVADQLAGGMLVTRQELEAILATLAAGDRLIESKNDLDRVIHLSDSSAVLIGADPFAVFECQKTVVGRTLARFTDNAKRAIGR